LQLLEFLIIAEKENKNDAPQVSKIKGLEKTAKCVIINGLSYD